MVRLRVPAFPALLAASACTSPAQETPEDCIERFVKHAEFIGFLDREKYDTVFTYRFLESSSLPEFMNRVSNSPTEGQVRYQIADGRVIVTMQRRSTPTGDIIAEGCKGAPENAILEGIERVPASSTDE
jgi:hypothetical protein